MAPEAPAGAAQGAAAAGADAVDAAWLHVARRLTFGPTPPLLEELARDGFDAWWQAQLQPQSIDDLETDRRLWALSGLGFDLGRLLPGLLPTLDGAGLTPLLDGTSKLLATVAGTAEALEEALLRYHRGRLEQVLAELRLATVVRATYSRRQLLELMVDLWWNHFNAWPGKSPLVAGTLAAADREVIRPHALGRFSDLLQASAASPVMLFFLDGWLNRADAPNENFGRELLELHTVGTASGFSEHDVRDATRVFTGWTVDLATARFRFEPAWHDSGPKQVLGWTTTGRSGSAGVDEGRSLLAHLAAHPATATNVAAKLVQRFVADDPPPELVASTAATYLSSGTSIAATIDHVVRSDAFRASAGSKVRRPLDFLVGALRATGADIGDPIGPSTDAGRTLDRVLQQLGQRPFDAASPAGYPEEAASWLGAGLLAQWATAHELARGELTGLAVDAVGLAAGADTVGAAVDAVLARLHGGTHPDRRAVLLDAVGAGEHAPVDPAQLPDLVGLALCAAEAHIR